MPTAPAVFHPSQNFEEALDRALKVWGVESEYYDIWGHRHVVTQPVAKAILGSLGVPTGSQEELDAALQERAREEWIKLVPSTVVLSAKAPHVSINVPEAFLGGSLKVQFHWESGGELAAEIEISELARERAALVDDGQYFRHSLPMPPETPLGYHRMSLQMTAGQAEVKAEASLIICPDRAFYPEEDGRRKRAAGIAVSLYGIRSDRNWGCGDFGDLEKLAVWVRECLGGSFISLNPLHAIPNRQPYNTSPYLPMCSFYKNPLYIDIEALEDFGSCPDAQQMLASEETQTLLTELRASKYVEYERIWDLKKRFLRRLFYHFVENEYPERTARVQAFQRFIQAEGDLLDRYALYCAIDEFVHHENPDIWIWPDWPEQYRNPDSHAVSMFAKEHWRDVLFYKFVQWQLELQLEAAYQAVRSKGLTIGLYHDLALATDRCGGDLWAYRPFYTHGCRVGAPPDDFSPKGQDWAFPPPNTVKHRQDGYRLFADSIRNNLRHGGALRIDHVMRFFRLYWIPEGFEATDGTYVRENYEDLLHILALESVRNRVIIVGEDLGTVEPEIREVLQRFGILSYRLLYFERTKEGEFKLPNEYPEQALISVSTHDLPTLAGFWGNRDIEARREAGLLTDEGNYRQQLEARIQDKQKLLDLFFRLNLVPDYVSRNARDIPDFIGELHNAAVGFLATSPSELMCLNQEDLLKELDQQNLPGSTSQYPNWRHKMAYKVEELGTDPFTSGCSAMFRGWVQRSGRTDGAPQEP